MNNKICLFHDYLSDIPPKVKVEMLNEMHAEVIDHRERNHKENERPYNFTSDIRSQYREVVIETRKKFGRYAPNALSAIIRAHGDTEWSNIFSKRNHEFFGYLSEMPSQMIDDIPIWALDSNNWFHIASKKGTYELQSEVSSIFPCTIFDDVPIECLSPNPEVSIENFDEILRTTGIYQAWQNDNFGENSKVIIIDTGITDQLRNRFSIEESTVGGLPLGDTDGHGTAISEMVLALAPKTKVESIKVMGSYSEGNIWNLISALSSLYKKNDCIINISLGVIPNYINSLGSGAISFRDSITNIVDSASSQKCFIISAAGNDSNPYLRWPSAAPNALAVGGHNASVMLSSFSNFSESAQNYILTPGGELRSEDHKLETFGNYGIGLARSIYGTSFSCAIASGVSAILQSYGWFRSMDIPSRISLFRNHCKKNSNGYPILNIADIGAVWPLKKNEPLPLDLFSLLARRG